MGAWVGHWLPIFSQPAVHFSIATRYMFQFLLLSSFRLRILNVVNGYLLGCRQHISAYSQAHLIFDRPVSCALGTLHKHKNNNVTRFEPKCIQMCLWPAEALPCMPLEVGGGLQQSPDPLDGSMEGCGWNPTPKLWLQT